MKAEMLKRFFDFPGFKRNASIRGDTDAAQLFSQHCRSVLYYRTQTARPNVLQSSRDIPRLRAEDEAGNDVANDA